jgi:hypothetical protein
MTRAADPHDLLGLNLSAKGLTPPSYWVVSIKIFLRNLLVDFLEFIQVGRQLCVITLSIHIEVGVAGAGVEGEIDPV